MYYSYNNYLAHYGIKGMKWGVRRKRKKAAQRADREAWKSMSRSERRANRDNRNKRYSNTDRAIDQTLYGKGGVKRINRRMNKGQSHAQAYMREVGRTTLIGLGAYAAFTAAMNPDLVRYSANWVNTMAKMKAQDLINQAKAKNAERMAREMIPRLVENVTANKEIPLKPWQFKID